MSLVANQVIYEPKSSTDSYQGKFQGPPTMGPPFRDYSHKNPLKYGNGTGPACRKGVRCPWGSQTKNSLSYHYPTTWRIIPVSKWLITMGDRKSPKDRVVPLTHGPFYGL